MTRTQSAHQPARAAACEQPATNVLRGDRLHNPSPASLLIMAGLFLALSLGLIGRAAWSSRQAKEKPPKASSKALIVVGGVQY